MDAAEVTRECSRAWVGDTGSKAATGGAGAHGNRREAPGARDGGRGRAVLRVNDTHFCNRESGSWDQLGGDCGAGRVGAPAPPAPSWRWALISVPGTQGAGKERTSAERAALGSRGGPGRAVLAREKWPGN